MKDDRRNNIHQLNKSFLEVFHESMMELLGNRWIVQDWIINVILLHRVCGPNDVASLETSATYYKGSLIASTEDLDPQLVGHLDQVVSICDSMSGLAIEEGEIQWFRDFSKYLEVFPDRYCEFDKVSVNAPLGYPQGEFVFPMCLRVETTKVVIGVLNAEYFPENLCPCPFDENNETIIKSKISKLLESHASFLNVAGLQELHSLSYESFETVHRDLRALQSIVLRSHLSCHDSGVLHSESIERNRIGGSI